MPMTTEEQKQKVADLLFTEGRVIDTLSNLKKGNESREYDGDSVLQRSARTVEVRARRYGNAVLGMTDKKR